MCNLDNEEKQIILDNFGKIVVENVRDNTLSFSINVVNLTTPNVRDLKKYSIFSELTSEQKEKIFDLLSETINDTIYRFMKMFEEHEDEMQLNVKYEGHEYNMLDISEEIGAEITFDNDNGWIQKFSKVGRFVKW